MLRKIERFEMLGIMLRMHCLYAIVQCTVFAKSGKWRTCVSKTVSPLYFYIVIAIYVLLSFALIAVF